jgi:hypothetical protein
MGGVRKPPFRFSPPKSPNFFLKSEQVEVGSLARFSKTRIILALFYNFFENKKSIFGSGTHRNNFKTKISKIKITIDISLQNNSYFRKVSKRTNFNLLTFQKKIGLFGGENRKGGFRTPPIHFECKPIITLYFHQRPHSDLSMLRIDFRKISKSKFIMDFESLKSRAECNNIQCRGVTNH